MHINRQERWRQAAASRTPLPWRGNAESGRGKSRSGRAAAAAACQAALLLVVGAVSCPAQANGQEELWRCPRLLMDAECDQYRQRLDQAGGEDARARIRREYEQVLTERREACPYSMTQLPVNMRRIPAQAGLLAR